MRLPTFPPALVLLAIFVACGGGATDTPRDGAPPSPGRAPANPAGCGSHEGAAPPGRAFPDAALRVPKGFVIETIASIGAARELAPLPNGDLIVGTDGSDLYIVPNAEATPGSPQVFATLNDEKAEGVTFVKARCEIYAASMHHVWAIPYHGERKAPLVRRIADVRRGPVAPGTDGDVHTTTSVAYTGGLLYAAAGSSCNATMDGGKQPCTEVDPTRAAVSVMNPDGSNFAQRAKRIRNAIALAVNPETGSLWVGDAGQDRLPFGHPYEYLDDLSAHPGDADYGWPECEENHHVYWQGYNCTKTVEPLVELPAYSTIIGATFYPAHQPGPYGFPFSYRGGLFAATHGSWHTTANGCKAEPPRVVFVAMKGDRPAKRVDWNDPTTQWTDFVTGFQTGCDSRVGRATGIAVGTKGSLFIADDDAGLIYRARPTH
jgi:glucose/arabinose dehydrogenase